MNGTRKRETFIALRACKQGHQIATHIINPHLEVPEFHNEPIPVEELCLRSAVPPMIVKRPVNVLREIGVVILALIISAAWISLLVWLS